jgi:predicted phosphodiesterase
MTRLAVLADIHGNLPALEAVIADMQPYRVDQVIVAGDSINWCPYSPQVIERLFDERWAVIRGNHEFYMLYYNTPHALPHWASFPTPRWLNEQIPQRLRTLIASLPDELRLCYPDAPYIRVVHGSPGDHWCGIYPTQTTDDKIRQMLAQVTESWVMTGHTHLVLDRCVDHWRILNPGAVGIPLDGTPGIARYMLLDGDHTGWQVTPRSAAYDTAEVLAECERQDYIGKLGVAGFFMMEEIRRGRPLIYGYYQWLKRDRPNAPDTLALAQEYLSMPELHWEFRLPDYHLNRHQE